MEEEKQFVVSYLAREENNHNSGSTSKRQGHDVSLMKGKRTEEVNMASVRKQQLEEYCDYCCCVKRSGHLENVNVAGFGDYIPPSLKLCNSTFATNHIQKTC